MSQAGLFEAEYPSAPSQIVTGLNVIRDGVILFFPDFFAQHESDFFFKSLRRSILWKQESMQMYGKNLPFPRLTAWYGDKNRPYTFSGITLYPHDWIPDLLNIKEKIESLSEVSFNSVLLNLYRNGNDSISWHTDAEKELGLNPVIASVNFGATRAFQIRHVNTKEKLQIPLKHGSVLIMKGPMQHFWQHQVPKTSKPVNERINLTFRVLK